MPLQKKKSKAQKLQKYFKKERRVQNWFKVQKNQFTVKKRLKVRVYKCTVHKTSLQRLRE